jgi:hypothetical protein
LKEEALDRTVWKTRFGSGYGPVVRQTTEWMNTCEIWGCHSGVADDSGPLGSGTVSLGEFATFRRNVVPSCSGVKQLNKNEPSFERREPLTQRHSVTLQKTSILPYAYFFVYLLSA